MLNPNAKPYQYQKKMIPIMSPSAYYYHKATLPVPLPPPPQLIQPSFYLKPSLPLPSPQLYNPFYRKSLLYYPPLPSFRPPPPPPPLQHEHQQPLLPHENQQPLLPHEHQQPPLQVSPKTQEYYCMMHKINKNKKKDRIMTKPKNAPSSSPLSFANSSTTQKRRSPLSLPYFAPGSRFVPRGPRQYRVQMPKVNYGSSISNNKYSSCSEHNIEGLVNHTSSGNGVYLSRPAANKKSTTKTTTTTSSSTSVMMRNIPNALSRKMLMDIVDQHCIYENNKALRMLNHSYHQDNSSPSELTISEYDFLYLPVDFVSKGNLGYAFINFTTCVAAIRFYKAFDNYSWESYIIKSPKICKICPARIQGKDGLVERFKHSYFQCDTDDFLPVSFSPPRNGYTSRSLPSLIGKRPKTSRKRINRTSH